MSDSKQIELSPTAAKAQALETAVKVNQTDDVNIEKINPLIPPAILMENCPLSELAGSVVSKGRSELVNILEGRDSRLFAIVGPCSIHDVAAAMEYAQKLVVVAEELKDDLLIVMRVYFEKPRTTVGWKGLINDPNLDESFNINKGLQLGRQLLMDVNELGLPCGVEFLDVISPQFLGDLVSWGAIGARTTESQIHRELASGLSCPVGFKNGTTGNLDVCAGAIASAAAPHRFLSVTKQGLAAIVSTKGNPHCHTILRGGSATGPNFDISSVAKATTYLKKAKVSRAIVVDCSHGNSNKNHNNQPVVSHNVAIQVATGNKDIVGVMIESNLFEGAQKLPSNPENLKDLKYGVSVTDACVSWEATVPMLRELAAAVRDRREGKNVVQYLAKL